MKQQARDYLIKLLYDYTNNYFTIGVFAEHNGLTSSEAVDLIRLAREIESHNHPEA